jgi:Halocarboxylic acid dehydrogenase DehI
MARPKPISERVATGEIERVYHEIKQTLRVTGVPLNFRTIAGYDNILPLFWDELHSNLQTRDFETGADRIRARAAQSSAALLPAHGQPLVMLGESQRFQIQRALKLYHYINPKLLLLTSALKISLHGENIGRADADMSSTPLIARGIPRKMYPMEFASDPHDDERVQGTYDDIQRTMSLSAVFGEYRTLALWPEYLISSWQQLKPMLRLSVYREAAEELRQLSVHLARELPFPVRVTLRSIEAAGEEPEQVLRIVERFESLLPSLILNNSFLLLDWLNEQEVKDSPYPASDRHQPLREAQAV